MPVVHHRSITRIPALANNVLRGRVAHEDSGHPAGLLSMGALLVAAGALYGATMGSYDVLLGPRPWQMLYSGLKLPLLLLATFALSLPTFFIVNTILGMRADFGHAVRALVAAQTGLTVVLVSFAPFTVVWYVSFGNYDAAIVFNGFMFAIASVASQRIVQRLYQPLIERNPRHRTMLRVWLVIYAFVGIQMAWVLRPFIGKPELPTQFFRGEQWGNAYVELVKIIWRAVGGI
jgi:hypothetical protein